MIIGTHILLYSSNADADRKFLRDVLGLKSIDVGGGWLIFAMPPAEAGVHQIEGEFTQQHAGHSLLGCVLYLMCDDLDSEMASLKGKNVDCSEAQRAEWGRATTIPLPSGGRIGLYQPAHPTAFQRQ
jgi:catechol 2,3-dioxygenase-like lactoylglutathione lyase family enzyme